MQNEIIASKGEGEEILCLPGLSLGSLLQVKFEGLGMAQTNLIGMDTGKFLILRTPLIPDLWSKLYQKNHAILRYLYNGRVYGFRSTLLELVKKPYDLSILSYPDKLEYINLRRYDRISCQVKAEVSFEDRLFSVTVTDISEGGCSFVFNKSDGETLPVFRINDEVVMTLYLNENVAPIVITSHIRVFQVNSDRIVAGVKFMELAQDNTKIETIIKEFILSCC